MFHNLFARFKMLKLLKKPYLYLTLSMLFTIATITSVLAVTYWTGTLTISQSFAEGGTATLQSFGLPTGFPNTPANHYETKVMNVSTNIDGMLLTLDQTTGQRTNLQSLYSQFTIDIVEQSSGLTVMTWDLLTDTSVSDTITPSGSYDYDYDVSYTPLVSSGNTNIQINVSLHKP